MNIYDAEELIKLIRNALNVSEGYNGTENRVGLSIGPAYSFTRKYDGKMLGYFTVFEPETGEMYRVSVVKE